MKHFLTTLILFSFLTISCDKKDLCNVPAPTPGCICTAQYDPVCGCDNVTYGNACNAGCANVPSYSMGECQ